MKLISEVQYFLFAAYCELLMQKFSFMIPQYAHFSFKSTIGQDKYLSLDPLKPVR